MRLPGRTGIHFVRKKTFKIGGISLAGPWSPVWPCPTNPRIWGNKLTSDFLTFLSNIPAWVPSPYLTPSQTTFLLPSDYLPPNPPSSPSPTFLPKPSSPTDLPPHHLPDSVDPSQPPRIPSLTPRIGRESGREESGRSLGGRVESCTGEDGPGFQESGILGNIRHMGPKLAKK